MILRHRIMMNLIDSWINKGKVIVLTGARQVGKTTLLKKLMSTKTEVLWLNADELSVRTRLANQNIDALDGLLGEYKFIVIDEVQRIANAGLLLKLMIDNFQDKQFIATGSSALEISETIFEPLTGRHVLFHLFPFSLSELYTKNSAFEIEQKLPFHLLYGNYPDIYNHPNEAEVLLKNLSGQYLYKDVLVWKDIRKPALLDKLLKLLALQVTSEVSFHELAIQLGVKSETVESYIRLLEQSYVIFRLDAYSNNPRKEVTKMSKIYFWDNGVRNAIIDNFNPLENRTDIGQLWENFLISERMKINIWQFPNRKNYFWRNYNQSEVDLIETEKTDLRAFEIKWNTKKKHSVTKAFINAYPQAITAVVTPLDFVGFCGM